MRRYISYLKYVLLHKWFVFVAGLRVDVPIWQLIIHDLSKFSLAEFLPYAKHFYNPDGSRANKNGHYLDGMKEEFELAWVHHQHKNRHHWQAWVSIGYNGKLTAVPIPMKYAREMLADWIGAGRAISGDWQDIYRWYPANKDKIVLHPVTRSFIEAQIQTGM